MIGKAVEFIIMHAAFIVPVVVVVLLVVSRAARSIAGLVLRVLARVLLLVAVVALVYDGTRTLAGGSGIVLSSLAEHWQALAPRSLMWLQGVVGRTLPAQTWESIFMRGLTLPAWLVIGVLGMLLAWIGRKRERVAIYAN
jgi:hypothetical protein